MEDLTTYRCWFDLILFRMIVVVMIVLMIVLMVVMMGMGMAHVHTEVRSTILPLNGGRFS